MFTVASTFARNGVIALGVLTGFGGMAMSAPLGPIDRSALPVSSTLPIGGDFNIGIGIGLPLFGGYGGYYPGYYGGYYPGYYGGYFPGYYGGYFPGYYGGYYPRRYYGGYYPRRHYGGYYPRRYYGGYYPRRHYGGYYPRRHYGGYYPRAVGGGITCTPRLADAGRC
jgi:hypothetical protein